MTADERLNAIEERIKSLAATIIDRRVARLERRRGFVALFRLRWLLARIHRLRCKH